MNHRIESWKRALWTALVGVASFHLAFSSQSLSFLLLPYLWSLYELRLLPTRRLAFYSGLGIGFACFGPQLLFFWRIFSVSAVALWLIIAFWIGLFAVVSRECAVRFGSRNAALLAPWLWMGFDYFRGELYFLRFSWFSPGFAFTDTPNASAVFSVGTYGIGWFLMTVVAANSTLSIQRSRRFIWIAIAALALVVNLPKSPSAPPMDSGLVLEVAGVQLEFPSQKEVLAALNALDKKHSNAQLIVLSEYTFDGPVPDEVKRWCKDHGKYLMAGGKDRVGEDFYNTAFVVGPDGEICFKQGKSVPIQFFKDGLPARTLQLWDSPWGKIGVCVCYDLSYRRVVDRLVKLGAAAIVSPMMDLEDWGARQHFLHSWVPPVRAAEYRVPVFRVGSSGISQIVERNGQVVAVAPFPGRKEMIAGKLILGPAGRLPLDHWLGPLAVFVTIVVLLGFCLWRKPPKL